MWHLHKELNVFFIEMVDRLFGVENARKFVDVDDLCPTSKCKNSFLNAINDRILTKHLLMFKMQ